MIKFVLPNPSFCYRATYERNYDGDTIVFNIDVGFRLWMRGATVRLFRVDCEEIRGTNRNAAIAAKEFVQRELVAAKEIRIKTLVDGDMHDKPDSFGRYLADVYYFNELINEWKWLNNELVEMRHAKWRFK